MRKWEGDEGIGEALQARVAEALTERGMMEGGYDPLSPQIVAVVHDVVMKEKKKRGVWNGNERRWLDELTADVEAMAAWARLERGDRGMRRAARVQDEYEEVDGYAEDESWHKHGHHLSLSDQGYDSFECMRDLARSEGFAEEDIEGATYEDVQDFVDWSLGGTWWRVPGGTRRGDDGEE